MLIKQNNTQIQVYYDGCKLELVKEYKYLGLTVDYELKWNTHVGNLAAKTRKLAGLLKKIGNRVPDKIKMSIYYSLFHSSVTYGIGIWGTHSIRI